MAELTTIIDQLREALDANLDAIAELEADSTRIRLAMTALTGSTAAMSDAPVARVQVETRPRPVEVRPSAAKAKPKANAAEKIDGRGEAARRRAAVRAVCPDCGQEMSASALGSHRARHKKRPGSTLAVAASAPAPPTPAPVPKANGERVLACSECDAMSGLTDAKSLANHTIKAHKRGPLATERTPVAA